MSHPSFSAWYEAIRLEHIEDLKQITKATILFAEEKRAVCHELIVKLETRAMKYSRVWNEKITEVELINDPKMFMFRHKSLETGSVVGEILTVERSGRHLTLTLAGNDPFLVKVDDQIDILPSLFLEKLRLRMEDRLASEASLFDYRTYCHGLLAQAQNEASRLMMGDDPGASSTYHALKYPFRPAQAAAIEAGKQLKLSFVWGPPGTGKTHTLGHLVAQLINGKKAQKVLALATANRAIEQLLLRVDNAYHELNGTEPQLGTLLRTQVPNDEMFETHPHLTAWGMLDRDHFVTLQRFDTEESRLDKLHTLSEDEQEREELKTLIHEQRLKRKEATETYKLKRVSLIDKAQAVFSSVNQHSWVPDIMAQRYDVIIFEEASMIPFFQIMDVMECHPDARYIFSGDPKQLPPIIDQKLHNNSVWVQNPFHFFNAHDVSQAPTYSLGEASQALSAINFLNVQSRMPKQLGDAISNSFYEGRLLSSREEGEFKRLDGLPDGSVIHLDKDFALYWDELRAFTTEVSHRIDRERTDEDEAKIAVILARKALNAGRTVLLLTPFRNQRKMIDSLLTQDELDQGIKCSTIHSAQGDEAEVVIFSMVSPDHQFLRGDQAMHLHNVALSRAQEQIIIISDFLIEDNKHYQKIMDVWELWDR